MGNMIMKSQKILGVLGMMLLTLSPVTVSAEESETAPTCYDDGTFSPVTSDGSDIFANGTSLIFKDGKMYHDFEPYGEFGSNDKHIYTEPFFDEFSASYDGKNEMSLTYSYLHTGGIDDTKYGDCQITIENTTLRGVYVDDVNNAVVNIKNADVLRNYIENAAGNVSYTIDSNTNVIQEIYMMDVDAGDVDENGGIVQGNLNLTLNHVSSAGAEILASGTVLGDTRITINDSTIKSVNAAHHSGNNAQKGNVYVELKDSTLKSVMGTSSGYSGTPAYINGNVEINVNNCNIELGIYKYTSNIVKSSTQNYENIITGTSTVSIADSSVRDVIDKGGYTNKDSLSKNAQVYFNDTDVTALVCNQANLKGSVTVQELIVNNLKFENNATLISNQKEHQSSCYVLGQLSGVGNLKMNIKDVSQDIYFEGKTPIAQGTKIKLIPVHLEKSGYVPYSKTETLPREVSYSFKKCKNFSGYQKNFTCDNYSVVEKEESGNSIIYLVKKGSTNDKKSVEKLKFSMTSSKTYTGKSIKPSLTVKDGSKKLKNGTDYKVTYKNNKNIGKATVTVTGKGKYSGTKKLTFKILPKKTTISSAKSTKRKTITVKWKKDTKVTGYVIQYSTDKNFKKNVEKITINKNKTTSAKITKLKSNKTYYVRVASYKKVDKKTYTGEYSKVKKVKVK